MANIQKLIKSILSDDKLTGGDAPKVYRDEPILITASQMHNFTPPKYREMRRLASRSGFYYDKDARIFYEQAKFMEDFEDDFDYPGTFSRYYPTYQAMTDIQLRGYFSWRTKVRQGKIQKTSLSFAFVYIYELLHQIGISTFAKSASSKAEESFHMLKAFWKAYRNFDSGLDRYVTVWLKDYVVYYNLDKSLLEGLLEEDTEKHVFTLLNYKSSGVDEVFTALNMLSSYNLEGSRFFKQYPEDVKAVVYAVFSTLSDSYESRNAHERFFGRVYANPYAMFTSAVFCPPDTLALRSPESENSVYEISDIYKYRCRNGNWSCERFFCYGGKNQPIGSLLKTVDFLMRQKYNFRSPLKMGKIAKRTQAVIEKEIDAWLESKRVAALPRIEIDVSKLQGIRKAAQETQSKLIVDEDTYVPDVITESVQENRTGLTDIEYQFMESLLYNTHYELPKGILPSVLIDRVNEHFFELFGDTVLIENGGAELVDEYIEDLKGMIHK